MSATPSDTTATVDVAIVGGGIAGLWVLAECLQQGYNAVLFEADRLGCMQTLASQGMIHGGLKYTLGGERTRAFDAIAGMPAIWNDCLRGAGPVNLQSLQLLSSQYYLFASGGLGRMSSFFASKALRGSIRRLESDTYPDVFKAGAGFHGTVYAMNDIVVSTPHLLELLAQQAEGRVFRCKIEGDMCDPAADGYRIRTPGGELHTRFLVSCAGSGADSLLQSLAIPNIQMQRRPLHQVIVRTRLPAPLYAHCLTNIARAEPRLTLTTHPQDDHDVLYIGGQIATSGTTRNTGQQIDTARRELDTCLPWLDFSQAEFATLTIDRAEPLQHSGEKPDAAFAVKHGRFIQCWPTKLTLAPDAGAKVRALLDPPMPAGATTTRTIALQLPAAEVAPAPWTSR